MEGLGNIQNVPKVLSERGKTTMQEKHRKSITNMKRCKTRTLTKRCIYHTDLMFLLFVRNTYIENLDSNSEAF